MASYAVDVGFEWHLVGDLRDEDLDVGLLDGQIAVLDQRVGYGVDLDFERVSSTRILKIAVVTGPLVECTSLPAAGIAAAAFAAVPLLLFAHAYVTRLREDNG